MPFFNILRKIFNALRLELNLENNKVPEAAISM